MAVIEVDRRACIRCGACVDVCPIAKVFELSDETATAVRPEACWRCGQCVAVCPTDAIDHDEFPLEECPLIEEELIPSLDALTTAFRARRSCRTFEERPVPRELVRELVTLSRWAPSAMNSQSIDWVAFDDPEKIAELTRTIVSELRRVTDLVSVPLLRPFISLAVGRDTTRRLRRAKASIQRLIDQHDAGEDPIFYRAPVLLVGHAPKRNRFGRDDAIYAAYTLMLAAERLGLGTCQIGYVQAAYEKSARFRELVTLPEGRTMQVAIALGYPRYAFRRLLPRRSPNLAWNPR